jgi:hypothetical protein
MIAAKKLRASKLGRRVLVRVGDRPREPIAGKELVPLAKEIGV